MMTATAPKFKKMAFSIENLARSSHDEPKCKEAENKNYSAKNGNNIGSDRPPCVIPHGYGHYSPIFYNGFYSLPSQQSVPGENSLISPPPIAFSTKNVLKSAEKKNSTSCTPKPEEKTPLRLPLSSTGKRKRDDNDSGVESPSPDRSRHSSEASFSSNSSYASDIDDLHDDSQKKKKARTAFTTEQINELEKRYQVQKYLPANERSILAERLGLADQQVKTWFQNRRMKEKRQQRDDEHARSFALPTGGVDVSQLAALGMPCPPPYNIQGTPVHSLPGFHNPQFVSPSTSHPRHVPYPMMMPFHPALHGVPSHLSSLSQPLHVNTRQAESGLSPITSK